MSDLSRMRSHPLRKRRFLILVAVFCAALLLSNCRGQGKRWRGKIDVKNGIVVVQNPAEPLHPNAALNFMEELSIGREDAGDEYLFSDISGLDVDGEGRIYVINRADANVRVFDASGLFLKAIGRKGQGPGEMLMPLFVQVEAGREIFVVDYAGQKALYFGLDGTFLRQRLILQPFQPIRRNSQGKLIGMEILAPPPAGGSIIRAYDSGLRPLFEIAREEQGARGVFDIGKPSCYCAVRPDDSVVWGDSKEYVLYVLDSEGRQVRRITKPYEPVPISGDYREAMRERYAEPLRAGMTIEFRSHFPAFSGIFPDDTERVFVKTYERANNDKGSFYYDVFDSEGRFYAKVPIKVNLDRNSVWKDGRLLTHEISPEGLPRVKRYKVVWTD